VQQRKGKMVGGDNGANLGKIGMQNFPTATKAHW